MSASHSVRGSSRRRGDSLLESIYDAVATIFQEQGYAKLTFVEIARVAHTSRTVLYRRWGTPLNLIHALTSHRAALAMGGDMLDLVEDTGSLRDDLLWILSLYAKLYTAVGPDLMNAVLFEMSQDNAQVPAMLDDVGFRNSQVVEKVINQARARGDKIGPLSATALTLPFDLIRMGHLWRTTEFDQARLEELVDDILIPVFTHSQASPEPHTSSRE